MKLEEAIKRLKADENKIDGLCEDIIESRNNAIEIVLKELDNSISKDKIKNKLLELDKEEKEIYKKNISNNELYKLAVINEQRTLLQELLKGNN